MFMGGEDLRNWTREAPAGASLCLGVAAALPARSIAEEVRVLADAGLIDVARRKVGPERYSFVVQRRSRRFIDTPPAARRGGRHAVRAGTVERRILKLLIAAATRGQPCPTNGAIARAVGLSGELAASYRMRRLAARGLIRVDVPADPRLHRVVTIVASGKATRGGAR